MGEDKTPQTEQKEQNPQKNERRFSFFHITAIVLTVLLVIAIIVQISVMLWLDSTTKNLKNKVDKLPNTEESCVIDIQ